MPAFETDEPIAATIDVVVGSVRVNAADRPATTVEVRPTDTASDEDVRAAQRTRVEYLDGELLVRAPKLRSWLPRSAGGSVDVTIELPSGSSVHGDGEMTDFNCEGELRDCRIKTGLGRLRVDTAAKLRLKTGIGDISVDRATGHAELTAASGDVRARELEATAVVKTSSGDSWVGAAGGDLRVSAANGSIAVDRVGAGVVAKSATATSGWARLPAAPLSSQPRSGPRGGHPRGHRGMARRACRHGPGPQRARERRGAGPVGREGRGDRAHGGRRHRDTARRQPALIAGQTASTTRRGQSSAGGPFAT
jgi:hypothetical protein